jgi:hypothetical protein
MQTSHFTLQRRQVQLDAAFLCQCGGGSSGGSLALVGHERQTLLAAACDGGDLVLRCCKRKLQLLHLIRVQGSHLVLLLPHFKVQTQYRHAG